MPDRAWPGNYFYVEKRINYGQYDAFGPNLGSGIQIRYGPALNAETTGDPNSYTSLLDGTPETFTMADAALPLGRSIYDPNANVTFSALTSDSQLSKIYYSDGPPNWATNVSKSGDWVVVSAPNGVVHNVLLRNDGSFYIKVTDGANRIVAGKGCGYADGGGIKCIHPKAVLVVTGDKDDIVQISDSASNPIPAWVVPGPGTDYVLTGNGDDVALVKNNDLDIVGCGPGADILQGDAMEFTSGCEDRRY